MVLRFLKNKIQNKARQTSKNFRYHSKEFLRQTIEYFQNMKTMFDVFVLNKPNTNPNLQPVHDKARKGFVIGSFYDANRPCYTLDTLEWIHYFTYQTNKSAFFGLDVPEEDRYNILELGAGTGKLTKPLLEILPKNYRYIATEPSEGFLYTLKEKCPDITIKQMSADNIRLPDSSVKVVVAAQCFHWFANKKSVDEIHRVLTPNGKLLCVWNNKNWGVPWVKEIETILSEYYKDTPRAVTGQWKDILDDYTGFRAKKNIFEKGIFFEGTAESIADHFCSISVVAGLPENEKEALRHRFKRIIADYPEHKDKKTIILPFTTELYECSKRDEDYNVFRNLEHYRISSQ